VDLAHVGGRLGAGAHVGVRDDLQQRRAGAVEIDAGHAVKILVQRLARILLKVGAGDADGLCRAILQLDLQLTLADDGQLELGDLITLRQVRIEVIFTRKNRALADLGVHRQTEHHRHAHRLLVKHRQHAGQAEVHGTGLGVGLGAIGGGGTGEDLRFGRKLGVDLTPDNNFPFHLITPSTQWSQRRRGRKENT